MTAVWKFPLDIDVQDIPMPWAAKPLHVGFQGDQLCLWVLVQPGQPRAYRRVVVVGTGRPCPQDGEAWVGTAVGDPFVWHVFVGAMQLEVS